jgi:hypothetical protein
LDCEWRFGDELDANVINWRRWFDRNQNIIENLKVIFHFSDNCRGAGCFLAMAARNVALEISGGRFGC